MIKDKTQNQNTGDNSQNYQAGGDIFIKNSDLTRNDVKEIAYEVFYQNFKVFSSQAIEKVNERLDRFTEMLLRALVNKNSDLLNSFREPSMQFALYSAQKGYIKTDDKDVADLLVDILIERAEQNERNLLQIVLDDSLEVIPKLSNQQLDVLSLLFLLNHLDHKEIDHLDIFKGFLKKQIEPLTEHLAMNSSCYSHLQSTNCIIGLTGGNIGIMETIDFFGRFVGYGKGLLFNGKKTHEIKEILYSYGDYMQKIYGIWNWGGMNYTSLTPMGMTLAIANIKRKTGHNYTLSDWINEKSTPISDFL